jgi:hypothetical protein
MAAQSQASWFGSDEDQLVRRYEIQLESERQSTGGWEIIAGAFAIGAVVLFTVGCAFGSKTKRDHEKR